MVDTVIVYRLFSLSNILFSLRLFTIISYPSPSLLLTSSLPLEPPTIYAIHSLLSLLITLTKSFLLRVVYSSYSLIASMYEIILFFFP